MSKIFVIGDIHGAYRALKQCLERSAFDYEKDRLIALGDVADGWPETKACVDELLKINDLVYVLGNHDFWTLEWMETGFAEDVWFSQGGKATIESYNNTIPERHLLFFKNARHYFEHANKLFVHAGINPRLPLSAQSMHTLLWDRNFVSVAIDLSGKSTAGKLTPYDEVYVGHTPIQSLKPIQACEVWLMDTGTGWSGVLSLMNIDTKEIFTSDPVPSLYPGIEGRKKK